MDEQELERDVVIQKHSAELIQDLERSLAPFLRRPDGEIRQRVRARETARLVSQVLEPFQELPQLLDPHLAKHLPILTDALLEYLQQRQRGRAKTTSAARSKLLLPLSKAICLILYTFCKIRGEKVVVRFFSVETRHLELLLHAIEEAERLSNEAAESTAVSWSWHERYVILLWLSQLFFAPFDLTTIGSGDLDDNERPVIEGFQWPPQVPTIALRVIPLGIQYLASPGKERDGAKALLVRVAMRKDMQTIGMLQALVTWAIRSISPKDDALAQSPYFYIGSLSFLAGVLAASADTSTMDDSLEDIFYAIQQISSSENAGYAVINGSAVARKMMIKVTRSVTSLVLRESQQSALRDAMVETTIGYLLESLADNDTPVRLAASKALSMITLKLEPDMASQVVEAVLESLNRNVLWLKDPIDPSKPRTRDVTAVDPLEWHGLMLTLSHLLYRRSPPPENLSDIVHTLLMGLAFEQRGPSGASAGTNVRDAACFGVWALARRYTTAELLRVPVKRLALSTNHVAPSSMLQVIATDLVVAASLDPAGNIRRASSAALQELIGRHPDTVHHGIALVQAVDYHAVALRSRAIGEVSLQATRLSAQYGLALLDALLGWRGIGDMESAARRVAAKSFGILTSEVARLDQTTGHEKFLDALNLLLDRCRSLKPRQAEEKHGVLLSMASVFDEIANIVKEVPSAIPYFMSETTSGERLLKNVKAIFTESIKIAPRKPELLAEAGARLTISLYPSFLMHLLSTNGPVQYELPYMLPGYLIVSEEMEGLLGPLLTKVDACTSARASDTLIESLLLILHDQVSSWLDRDELEVIEAAAGAGVVDIIFSKPERRASIIRDWTKKLHVSSAIRSQPGSVGYFFALAQAHHITKLALESSEDTTIVDAFKKRWSEDRMVETRAAMLQSITNMDLLRDWVAYLVPIIAEGLDDYTSTARGDIGSLVRFEAIKATETIFLGFQARDVRLEEASGAIVALYVRILRLAAEKLDRVRVAAQDALSLMTTTSHAESFKVLSHSSKQYFDKLFSFTEERRLLTVRPSGQPPAQAECMSSMLAGLVTSADTGNEELVIASRRAVADYCELSLENISRVYTGMMTNLKIHAGQDRVIVPTLELLAYLFHIGMLQRLQAEFISLKQVCLLTQKACYKASNVRKLEAGIKVYGGVASLPVLSGAAVGAARQEGVSEAKKRLGALLTHPWPRVRNLVVDELYGLLSTDEKQHEQPEAVEKLMGVDWGRAETGLIKTTVKELGLSQ